MKPINAIMMPANAKRPARISTTVQKLMYPLATNAIKQFLWEA